jgi:autotransporter-associated beta strand protein
VIKSVLYPLLAAVVVFVPSKVRAGYLYPSPQGQGFIVPTFATEYSEWDVFYSPNGANYPDFAAPFGIKQSASAAGFTPPADSSPTNPQAYWNVNNPTLTQTNTAANAFIIGPGVSGNIYSFKEATSFVLNDTVSQALGTVVFQFQTEGTLVDFSSIKLVYNTVNGQQEISAKEYVREYSGSGSSFGGAGNRVALQWDLTGLGITSYQILFHAEGSSMSFQQAVLDTASTYGSVVPESRSWNKAGTGNWSTGSNWLQGSTSVANGNVKFVNSGNATITLDGSRVQGEVIFDTPSNVTINPSAGSTLTSNTGITTTEAATGLYTINSQFALGAPDFFDIRAGEVRMAGVVSGAYGFTKTGDGILSLLGNNTFTGPIAVEAGTLRLAGTNNYTGATSLLAGKIIVAANAPNGAAGALGNASSVVSVGDVSGNFAPLPPAELFVDGNFTVGRSVLLASGTDVKRLGAINASGGAVFSGTIDMNAANNVFLTAQSSTDRLTFSGPMTNGGTALNITIDGQGTVVYSGANKSYNSATVVNSGTLVIANGTQYTGDGGWSVSAGAKMVVNGVLSGIGALTLNGGTLAGSGTVNKTLSLENGDHIAPGDTVGTITLGANLTFASGGFYDWQIRDADGGPGTGWDFITINGGLNITAAAGQFVIDVDSLTLSDMPGLAADFNSSTGYVWKILGTTTGITGFDASKFTVNASGFQNTAGGQWFVSQTGNDLYLNYSPIPEPSTWMLLTFVAISAVIGVRLRRKSA